MTSIALSPELHENETTLSVTEPREYEETEIVAPQPSPPVELVTAESAISDEVSTNVQDSEPSIPVPTNLSINVQGKISGFLLNKTHCAKKQKRLFTNEIKINKHILIFFSLYFFPFWFVCLFVLFWKKK